MFTYYPELAGLCMDASRGAVMQPCCTFSNGSDDECMQ